MMALIRQQQLQQHATGLIGHASLMSGQTLLMPHSTASSSSSSTSSAAPMDNDEIVGRALKLLHGALSVFAGKMLQRCLGDQWVSAVRDRLRQAQPMTFVSTTFGPVMQEIDRKRQELAAEKETELGEKAREQDQLDLRDLLQCITRMWDVFRNVLKPGVRYIPPSTSRLLLPALTHQAIVQIVLLRADGRKEQLGSSGPVLHRRHLSRMLLILPFLHDFETAHLRCLQGVGYGRASADGHRCHKGGT